MICVGEKNEIELSRARPVVNLEAEISFLSEGGNIDMELKGCETREGEKVSCSQIRICVTYSGVGVDKKLSKYIRS